MKILLRTALLALSALVLLAACATVPSDGEAVQCEACDALWIRLRPASGAPGIYRASHAKRWQACPWCEALAIAYLQGGRRPERCVECGGELSVRPVNVTP
jgi:hypothetical protein